jgi:hypothetical protein
MRFICYLISDRPCYELLLFAHSFFERTSYVSIQEHAKGDQTEVTNSSSTPAAERYRTASEAGYSGRVTIWLGRDRCIRF